MLLCSNYNSNKNTFITNMMHIILVLLIINLIKLKSTFLNINLFYEYKYLISYIHTYTYIMYIVEKHL